MTLPDYEVVTISERPEVIELINSVTSGAWHAFMYEDPMSRQYWGDMLAYFPEFTFALLERDSGAIMAMGNSIPIVWKEPVANLPKRGWDWALEHGCTMAAAGKTPTTLCAIQIAIAADYRGKGVSQRAVSVMRNLAAQNGLDMLVAPVRPNLKAQYPLVPMERYIRWRRPDGLAFDAWLRVHERAGADIIKVAGESMRITGTIAEWEDWAGMVFPESGDYVIPGALNPVSIDLEGNLGTYIEPNVWMRHRLD